MNDEFYRATDCGFSYGVERWLARRAVTVVVVFLVDVGLGGRSENTKNTERYCDGISGLFRVRVASRLNDHVTCFFNIMWRCPRFVNTSPQISFASEKLSVFTP